MSAGDCSAPAGPLVGDVLGGPGAGVLAGGTARVPARPAVSSRLR